MKQTIAVTLAALVLSSFEACDSSTPAGSGGLGGGKMGTGGMLGSGGAEGTGGRVGTGGATGTGGKAGMGGRSNGGATGAGTVPGVCPYTAASFSCEAACENLHELYLRCQNDPSVPTEARAMLGLYGEASFLCTPSCAVVAPSSQAQWSCFQGIPDDAACSAIAECNATNCP